MDTSEYLKNGERVMDKSKIKPTREMQELIDTFWNTVKEMNTSRHSTKENIG